MIFEYNKAGTTDRLEMTGIGCVSGHAPACLAEMVTGMVPGKQGKSVGACQIHQLFL
jgi:hypothetical protein